jgi:benzodiazapine receptor
MRVPLAANHKPTIRFSWRMALLLAVGILLLGMSDALLSMLFTHGNPAKNFLYRYPPIWPADWVFWVVWIVIYPCLGVATAFIWQHRHAVPIRRALICFVVLLAVTLLFLPLSAVVQGNPIGLTLMDASAFLLSYALAWVYGRVTRMALWWLVPLLLWTPVTLLLKIWYWHLNF